MFFLTGHSKNNKESNYYKPDKRKHLLGTPAHLFHLSFYVPQCYVLAPNISSPAL